MTARLDAIVVGAGLSGLACARRLADAGARVAVVEAQREVGGRLRSARFGAATVDLGGAWLSVGQPRLAALAAELGVATVAQHRAGAALVVDADATDAAPRRLPGRVLAALAVRRAQRKVDALARAAAAGAADPAWDERTLADWLVAELGHREARAELALHAELVHAASPDELSLLAYVTCHAASGGFGDPRAELPGGGRERRFAGGAQALARALADRVVAAGGAVHLDHPVRAITDDHASAGVRIDTARGAFTAARAVVAVPPALAARLAWAPALPPSVHRLVAATRPGAVVKVIVGYATPFWRDAGLSGELYQRRGVVRAAVDLCEPDGTSPALLAFVVAGEARAWGDRDVAERRAAVIDELAAAFGDAAAEPTGLVEHDWARAPWAAGCVAALGPGAGDAAAAWRAPLGRVHVAGTESAASWPGHMEGALDAGERAAAEVLAALGAAAPRASTK